MVIIHGTNHGDFGNRIDRVFSFSDDLDDGTMDWTPISWEGGPYSHGWNICNYIYNYIYIYIYI